MGLTLRFTQQRQPLQVFAHYKALAAQAETDTAFVNSCHKAAGTLLPELRLPRMLEDLAGLRALDVMGDQQEPAARLTELLQQQLYGNAEYLVATYQVCMCVLCWEHSSLFQALCLSGSVACNADSLCG